MDLVVEFDRCGGRDVGRERREVKEEGVTCQGGSLKGSSEARGDMSLRS